MKRLALDFDIDDYLNSFIPYNQLHLLPKPLSWFLGYRENNRTPVGSLVVVWWSFLGAFVGLLVVEAVYMSSGLRSDGAPIVIASLGAAAILEFNTIESPLAQPRNALLGQILSAIVGISITKLFQHSPHFEELRFLSGALSVGVASAVMSLTKTIHPPAGATALLCSTSPEITKIGWFLLPLIIIGSVLLLAVGCILNNIQRTFPMYWWTAVNLRIEELDIENGEEKIEEGQVENEAEIHGKKRARWIVIDAERVIVPEWIGLSYEERAILDTLGMRLAEGAPKQGLEGSQSRNSEQTHVEKPSDHKERNTERDER